MNVEHTTRKFLGNLRGAGKGMRTGLVGAVHLEAYPPAYKTPEPIREAETGAANDLRITEAAKKAGFHMLPHAVAPPTEVPPADYVG